MSKVLYCGLFTSEEDSYILRKECQRINEYDTWYNHHATTSYVANKSEEELKEDPVWVWTNENLGKEVEVLIWKLYGDNRAACFTIHPFHQVARLKLFANKWLHITSGTNQGTSPVYSNEMLSKFIHTYDQEEYEKAVSKLSINKDLYIKLKLKVGYCTNAKVHFV